MVDGFVPLVADTAAMEFSQGEQTKSFFLDIEYFGGHIGCVCVRVCALFMLIEWQVTGKHGCEDGFSREITLFLMCADKLCKNF